MSALVDRPVRFDLAESTCPSLRLGDLLTPAVLARLADEEIGYGTTEGDPELRALIAADAGVRPDQVLVTAGASSALFLVTFSVCGPGDHAVLLAPYFPPTRAVLDALGVRTSTVGLAFDRGYRLDEQALEAVAAALTPSTRLVALASPQNPSGVRFTEPQLRRLVQRMNALSPRAVLLVDETYRESTYRGEAAPASAAGLGRSVVTCSSLSKAHGAPGLRVGWLTATDPTLRERLRAAKFNTSVCCSGVDEALAVEVLRRRTEVLADRSTLLTATVDILARWARAHADVVEFLPPDGGAMCCLRLRADRVDDTAVARFYAALAEREVRVAPGTWFAEPDRVFRIGFGHLPENSFRVALGRVGEVLSGAVLPFAVAR
jgi:aspartate/methionine/tyrosine aminotransferase